MGHPYVMRPVSGCFQVALYKEQSQAGGTQSIVKEHQAPKFVNAPLLKRVEHAPAKAGGKGIVILHLHA